MGDAEVVLTGGTDNMSACPYAVRDIRYAQKWYSLYYVDITALKAIFKNIRESGPKTSIFITGEEGPLD